MKFIKIFVSILLFFSVPGMAIPQIPRETSPSIVSESSNILEKLNISTYDELITYIDQIENENLERVCDPRDLDRLNCFMAQLAKVGLLSEDGEEAEELHADIEELLLEKDISYDFAYSTDDYGVVRAIFFGSNYEKSIQCKSWIKKTCSKIKKFVKKHKKELIIGAAVVIAATVVVVAVAASATGGAAAAVGGAAGAAASPRGNSKENSSDSSSLKTHSLESKEEAFPCTPQDSSSSNIETLAIEEKIAQHVSSFREFLTEDEAIQKTTSLNGCDNLSLKEKARELGAHLAHQAYEEVTQFVGVVPKLCEEVKEMGSKFLPESIFSLEDEVSKSPMENYANMVAEGHKVIDNIFSTDQSEFFSAKAKASDARNDLVIGIIPLPGGIAKLFSNTSGLVEAGNVIDRAGFTRVGRGLMKHGYRQNSLFPKPLGTPTQINQQGETILKEILNDPNRTVLKNNRGGIEIYAPNGRGAYFREDGTFRGFIEYGHK